MQIIFYPIDRVRPQRYPLLSAAQYHLVVANVERDEIARFPTRKLPPQRRTGPNTRLTHAHRGPRLPLCDHGTLCKPPFFIAQ